MNWDTVQQLVRILVQLGAGYMLKEGLITEDMVTTFVSATVSLGGIVWWIMWERKRATE
jgi:hypothetical protein